MRWPRRLRAVPLVVLVSGTPPLPLSLPLLVLGRAGRGTKAGGRCQPVRPAVLEWPSQLSKAWEWKAAGSR